MEGLYCELKDPQDHHQYNTWDMLQSPIIWLILDEFYFFSNITEDYTELRQTKRKIIKHFSVGG